MNNKLIGIEKYHTLQTLGRWVEYTKQIPNKYTIIFYLAPMLSFSNVTDKKISPHFQSISNNFKDFEYNNNLKSH